MEGSVNQISSYSAHSTSSFRLFDFSIFLSEFDLKERLPAHLEEEPAVAEAADVGFAVGSGAVAHGDFGDLQVVAGGAEDQIKIAEWIEETQFGARGGDL